MTPEQARIKSKVAEDADDRLMFKHERPYAHRWHPIGKDWFFCNGCHVWRHLDVLEAMKWSHGRK